MKKILFLTLLVFGLATACKKEQGYTHISITGSSPAQTRYLPLKAGNYWVYEMFTHDSAEVETSVGKTDSVFVQKDTMINGRKYYYLNQSDSGISSMSAGFPICNKWITDSSGFIVTIPPVTPYGYPYLLFDPVHLNDTIKIDTALYGVVYFTVPTKFTNEIYSAGTLSGISMDIKLRYLHPAPYNYWRDYSFTKYAAGVGLCHWHTSWVNGHNGYVWRLARYQLN
ncbi:MAG: hypothetical protein ACXVC6_02320 [Bacteroidia bacterium]